MPRNYLQVKSWSLGSQVADKKWYHNNIHSNCVVAPLSRKFHQKKPKAIEEFYEILALLVGFLNFLGKFPLNLPKWFVIKQFNAA